MKPEQMDRLIEAHLKAEMAGDSAGSIAMYTEDVEHDVVGTPHGPLHGKEAAQGFYDQLINDISTEEMIPTRRYYGEDFCVIEHIWNGTVPGTFLGVAGNGRRSRFVCCTFGSFVRGSSAARTSGWMAEASSRNLLATRRAQLPLTM